MGSIGLLVNKISKIRGVWPLWMLVAERQGFEPWVGVNRQRFSRPPHSTTLPPLRAHSTARFNGPRLWAQGYSLLKVTTTPQLLHLA